MENVLFVMLSATNHPCHPSLFGASRQHSQSRENINFAEDEVVGRSEGGIEDSGGSLSPGKMKSHQILCSYKPKKGLRI